jgi:signal peptidase II
MTDSSPPSHDRPDGPLSAVGLSVVVAVLVLDQASKAAAKAWLTAGQPVDIVPILALLRVNNQGMAFSMFTGSRSLVLTLVTFAITLVVLAMWWRAREGGRLAALAFALIVGGALGNLVDRVLHGHVVDFLFLHFGTWTLFIFNLADVALTIGPILLILTYLRPAR